MINYYALETVAGSGALSQDIAQKERQTAEATETAVDNLTAMLHLPSWVGTVIFILIVLIVAKIILKITNRFFSKMIDGIRESGAGSGTLMIFMKNVVRVLICFFAGVIIIYSIPGAKSTLNMVLASGGVIALIASVAGKDVLGNLAGGIMVLAFRPFEVGDFVTYLDKDVSGTVEEITLRHTVIRTPQNKRVIVPNGIINESVLQNSDLVDSIICEFFDISITYESNMEKAMDILRDEVEKNPKQLDRRTPEQKDAGEPKVNVKVVELADSAVIIRAWLWAKDTSDLFDLKFELNRAVKNRFDKEGIEFAYPHMTVVER